MVKLIDSFPANSSIEDLPFYRNYLSKFDVEHAFGCIGLKTPDSATKADSDLLQRFIYASFSSTYDLNYDEDEQKIILAINATIKNKEGENDPRTQAFDKLCFFQIYRLFEIYLGEMLEYEVYRNEGDDEKEYIDEARKKQLLIFEQKIREMKREQEKKKRKQKNRQESLALESDLDELLNS